MIVIVWFLTVCVLTHPANSPVDEIHCDGSYSRLRPDGEFIGNVALCTVDQNFSLFPHQFNWIEVWAFGQQSRMSAGDCDADFSMK
jgi:hypothetical protein